MSAAARRLLLACALAVAACGKAAPHLVGEAALRAQLGIPANAKHVIVFDQTSHLDIDWQKTFDGYYDAFVGDIFLSARQILQQQPRAFYSVAEMAYLEHHLKVHPEERQALVALAKRGQWRVVGGGLTSPDTLLPETEMLFRDYLFGAEFSEGELGVRPTAGWLPDSFGQGATAPDVLEAAGLSAVAFSRIDGSQTILDQMAHPDAKPPAGSTAALLVSAGSSDFWWVGAGGGRVLAHWMDQKLYCLGDDIDYDEPILIPGKHVARYQGDDPAYTDGRIETYIRELMPLSKTPYLFVPVGCDFQFPKPQLVAYLDGYDERHFAQSGVYAVAAPFDLYAKLVEAHGEALPTVHGSLTPYFMGFYGSHGELKRKIREAARPFFAAELLANALGDQGRASMQALQPEFEKLVRSDHHDFIPGTSADEVVATEQMPLLDEAEAAGEKTLSTEAQSLAARIAPAKGAVARIVLVNDSQSTRTSIVDADVPLNPPRSDASLIARVGSGTVPALLTPDAGDAGGHHSVHVRLEAEKLPPVSWRVVDLVPGNEPSPAAAVQLSLEDQDGAPATGDAVERVVLSNAHVTAKLERDEGFALTSLEIDGHEMLAGPSFAIADDHDMGGLYRVGSEMAGCSLSPIAPPGDSTDAVQVLDDDGLRARVAFVGKDETREVWLDADSDALSLALTSGAAAGTMRSLAFAFTVDTPETFATSLPGGYAVRPVQHVFTPTYWPAVEWATAGSAALLLRQSTGVTFRDDGRVELMAMRNAHQEQCDQEGENGTDDAVQRVELRLARATSPASASVEAQRFNRPVSAIAVGPQATAADLASDTPLVTVDGPGLITAVKPADRGGGTIIRALLMPGPVTLHLSPSLIGKSVERCDTSERDLASLGKAGAALTLDAKTFGSIATVRLK